jgi:transcriptional regulator with XRE-family HTH domain
VIDVATLNVIRRWALREQMSIREISRRTGLARNTVKKYLRSDETEPTYTRRVSPSKLDPYAEKLSNWLGIEATKSRKQRRNLKQIYTPNLKRRRSRTYPPREHLQLTKSVGQELMEILGQASAQFHTRSFLDAPHPRRQFLHLSHTACPSNMPPINTGWCSM